MADKTWDVEDPKELPYRLTHSPITDEVFVISFGFRGVGVSMAFENRESFHRFLVEALKLDEKIAGKVFEQSQEILREKQGV